MNPYLRQKNKLDKIKTKKYSLKRKGSRSVKSEIAIVIGLSIFTVATYFIWKDPNHLLDLIDKVEFRALAVSFAEDSSGKSSPVENKKLENKSSEAKSSQKKIDEKNEKVNSENDNYSSNLAKAQKDLEEREHKLKELEKELQSKQIMIEEKLVELEKMRRNISSVLKDRFEVDKMNVEKLVSYYSNMKPQNAAKVIEALEEPLATTVLSNMKKQNAAAIMNFLPTEKAKKITELLAGVN